jgi:hypothetical protein
LDGVEMKTHAIVLFRIYPGLENRISCADSWSVQLLGNSLCGYSWSVQLLDFLASLPESLVRIARVSSCWRELVRIARVSSCLGPGFLSRANAHVPWDVCSALPPFQGEQIWTSMCVGLGPL